MIDEADIAIGKGLTNFRFQFQAVRSVYLRSPHLPLWWGHSRLGSIRSGRNLLYFKRKARLYAPFRMVA